MRIEFDLTRDMWDAARQAGFEGREREWAVEVLKEQAARIVYGPKRAACPACQVIGEAGTAPPGTEHTCGQ